MEAYTILSLLLLSFTVLMVFLLFREGQFLKLGFVLPSIAFITFFVINSVGIAFYMSFNNDYESLFFASIVTISILSFFVGYFILPQKKSDLINFIRTDLSLSSNIVYYKTGFIALFLLVLVFSLLFYRGIPQFIGGLYKIITSSNFSTKDSADFMSNQRFMLTKSYLYGGTYAGQGLLHELQRTGWRFITVFSLIGFIYWKTRFWKTSLIISIIMMIIFLGGTGERAPLVFSILLLMITYSVILGIKVRQVLIFSTFAFFLLILSTVLGSRGLSDFSVIESYTNLLDSLFKRIFMGNGIHDYEVIGWVNSGKLGLRYGLFHLEKLISSLPGINIGQPLGIVTSYLRGSSPYVFSSGTYLGFVYADFSYMGIIIIYFVMGLFIRRLTVSILKSKRELLNTAFIIQIIFTVGEMTSFGFIGFLVQIIIIYTFYMFFKISARLFISLR